MKNLENKKIIQMKNITQYMRSIIVYLGIIIISITVKGQVQINAINADPSAKSITRDPLGSTIIGNAVLKFKFTNEATSSNNTGQIPAGSVRLTLSFPGAFAYTSVNNIPKFVVEDADSDPYGVVHLVNNQLILEGEIIDLLINVRSIANESGDVTFNVDRTSPIIVNNLSTANDNAEAEFEAFTVLPVNLKDFAAQKQNCTANLSWRVSNETNIVSYVMEVSNDKGASYQPIKTFTANNVSREQTYSMSYPMTNGNAYLYRIKINELSGQYTYSPIARISSGCGDAANEVLVYPSPAKSGITLSVSNPALINTRATIIDMVGKIHSSFIITTNTKLIAVDKLPAGMYMIRLDDGTSTKFLKQ